MKHLHSGYRHKLESGENREQKIIIYLIIGKYVFHYTREGKAKYATAPNLVGRDVLGAHSNC